MELWCSWSTNSLASEQFTRLFRKRFHYRLMAAYTARRKNFFFVVLFLWFLFVCLFLFCWSFFWCASIFTVMNSAAFFRWRRYLTQTQYWKSPNALRWTYFFFCRDCCSNTGRESIGAIEAGHCSRLLLDLLRRLFSPSDESIYLEGHFQLLANNARNQSTSWKRSEKSCVLQRGRGIEQ